MIIHKCARCGRTGARVLSNGKFFCSECAELFGTCGMCVHNKKCGFHSDPAPIPKVVTKRIRQETPNGYLEQIIQTPNPQRAKAFCLEAECICCKTCEDGKVRCVRQFNTCENYKEIEF